MEIYMEIERLILRSWKYEDRETFAEMNGNRNVMKYFPATLSYDESNAFVERIITEFEETGLGLYAVEIKEIGEFIGYVGFHRFTFNAQFSPGLFQRFINWQRQKLRSIKCNISILETTDDEIQKYHI